MPCPVEQIEFCHICDRQTYPMGWPVPEGLDPLMVKCICRNGHETYIVPWEPPGVREGYNVLPA